MRVFNPFGDSSENWAQNEQQDKHVANSKQNSIQDIQLIACPSDRDYDG
jgi:hypothetical protein